MNYTEVTVNPSEEFLTTSYNGAGLYLINQPGGIYENYFFIVSDSGMIQALGLMGDFSFFTKKETPFPENSGPDQKTVREEFALKMLSVVLKDNMKFKEIE